ncbi:MAG: YraN family protein [Clostridia bacterium]|nr:YraN family protein [Clostridia bacterium]
MNLGVTGKKGEDMVAAFLRKNGYTVIKQNYISRYGEIDIVASKEKLLLFIEVKTRRENSLIKPCEAVDLHKQNRMRLTAEDYLSKSETNPDLQPRFDVAEVTARKDGKFELNYIKNAF